MNIPSRVLIVASAACVALAGCASKPKSSPGSAPSYSAANPPPETDLPPGSSTGSGAVTRGSQEDLAATAGDRVFFALDSEALDTQARETLRLQTAWLAANGQVRARIAGNADERGTREYNLALGARRAAAVRQALIANGVAAARLETISYGKERPMDSGSGEEAWARNRNAQTVVIGIAAP